MDTKYECLQLTPLLLLDIAEHGVSSAKPFNAYNYARNVPRSTTASLEILPPAHTHTHTHRLVRNATNVRSFFVSADSVYTSKFTATTHATLSDAQTFRDRMGCVSGTYRLRIHVRNHEAKHASDSRPRYIQKFVANIVRFRSTLIHNSL